MKKIVREMQKRYPRAKIKITGGGHLRLEFPDGSIVFTSSSPSDTRFLLNVQSTVRQARRSMPRNRK
ncbi:hypothetical protein [Acidithiobacillus caldus]|uniref:hypothetical protein n=1 Tax=Acidithiobacillus caldus TaxID=33059 RepID=UPI001C0781AE|nr:hypothetical protein [Acidithiobacillus caldus]MBU2770090.1 hypothetical protein [Acidithiobacillus caldus]